MYKLNDFINRSIIYSNICRFASLYIDYIYNVSDMMIFLQRKHPKELTKQHLSTKLIPNKCEDLNKVMCTALHRASSVSVTVDIWSSRQIRSYLGITTHYISPDWERRSAMLACKPFSGRHTAENISAQFEETLTVFDISTKVSHVVSDSASNVRSAFSLPGYVQEPVEDLVGDDISDNEDSEIETDIVENIFAFLPEHDPCFAHTLQLVVKDGLKEAGALTKVIAKASKVVAYVRKSTIATDLLEGEGRLQAANATRWNSEVKMIRSVLKISQQKLDQLDCTKLTAYDRHLLQDLITILTPFEEATDIAQRQNIVLSSFVVPCVLGLKVELENMQSRYNCKLVAALKKSVDRRLIPFKDRAVFCLASTLDPRFKLQWCVTE